MLLFVGRSHAVIHSITGMPRQHAGSRVWLTSRLGSKPNRRSSPVRTWTSGLGNVYTQQPLGDGLERSFASLSPPSSTGGGHGKRGPHSGQADLASARSSSSESGHSSTPYGQATVCVSGSILTFRNSRGSSQRSKPPFPTRPLMSTWPSVPYSKRIQRRYSSRASISMVFSIGRPSCSSGSIS